MKLLAVETSTEACSAALMINGEIRECFELTARTHTKRLLAMIDELMHEAALKPQQLDAIAFSRGPGSFTGVRIATGVMQGIAFAADLPVVPVSTLAALAQALMVEQAVDVVFSALDARIGEIFWGIYQRNADGYAELVGIEQVIAPDVLAIPPQRGVGVGSGWGAYHELLLERMGTQVTAVISERWPKAQAVAQLGAYGFQRGLAVPVEQAMPVYLRDKVAQTEAERRAVALQK